MTPSPPSPDEPREEDTARLVHSAVSGDLTRFNALYERLAPALYTWAELRIGTKLRLWLDPADLVQEVWFRTVRSIGDFDPQTTSFRYWVFRVAKNALLEALRKSESPGAGAWQGAGNVLDQVPDSVTGVSRRLAQSEELERFTGWVEGLDESDRELVIHIGLEGMGHAQVGVRLALQTKTVTKRWQRLRDRIETQEELREILGG